MRFQSIYKKQSVWYSILGFCPKQNFVYKGEEIEICKEFVYLGVVLTTQLSATQHVLHIISKCNQRIGMLFSKLPMKSIPLPVALSVFAMYILPILTYALPVWFPKVTEESKKRLNSVFTKFLKRYLGLTVLTTPLFIIWQTLPPYAFFLRVEPDPPSLNFPSLKALKVPNLPHL